MNWGSTSKRLIAFRKNQIQWPRWGGKSIETRSRLFKKRRSFQKENMNYQKDKVAFVRDIYMTK